MFCLFGGGSRGPGQREPLQRDADDQDAGELDGGAAVIRFGDGRAGARRVGAGSGLWVHRGTPSVRGTDVKTSQPTRGERSGKARTRPRRRGARGDHPTPSWTPLWPPRVEVLDSTLAPRVEGSWTPLWPPRGGVLAPSWRGPGLQSGPLLEGLGSGDILVRPRAAGRMTTVLASRSTCWSPRPRATSVELSASAKAVPWLHFGEPDGHRSLG
jgi:hypothetical protein